MQALKKIVHKPNTWLILLAILLSACTPITETPPVIVDTPSPEIPTITPTFEPPTPTPQPVAAVVNGEQIPLAWFEEEVNRYLLAQDAMGNGNMEVAEARELVINDLIDQFLLAQGARDAGADFSESDVQVRIDRLAEDVDLTAWMSQWGYSSESLMETLRRQMLVAYQRDLIAQSVPDLVDQVELQQVFAFTEEGANRALVSLNSGTPFENVAIEFSPDTAGYIGWVPRGYLFIPAVEEAVFNQPIGTYTGIIESDIGYHIVLVIDRGERPLSSDARLTLERQALHRWLEERRENSTIELLID
jgi:parvulin-like peptidyl-prolyl isomerase